MVSANWTMLVHNVGGFMTISENCKFHEYLNKFLKSIKEDIISKDHAITSSIWRYCNIYNYMFYHHSHHPNVPSVGLPNFSLPSLDAMICSNDKVLSKITAIQ
jgi:hypothetical protein